MANPVAVSAASAGCDVLAELGVDKTGVTSFSLHFDAGDIVRLRVEYIVDKVRLNKVRQDFVVNWRQGEAVQPANQQRRDDATPTPATPSSGISPQGFCRRLRAAFASARARLWPTRPPLTREEQQLRQAIRDGFAGTRSTRRPAQSEAPTPASAAQATAPGES
jgi:hypothetical protein